MLSLHWPVIAHGWLGKPSDKAGAYAGLWPLCRQAQNVVAEWNKVVDCAARLLHFDKALNATTI
jgi:predicted carbohydrate-binding protein with CBM5 and CBM33 domain